MSIKTINDMVSANRPPTKLHEAELRGYLENWATLHEFMANMEADPGDLSTLLMLMGIEIASESPRGYIIDRIYMRFSNLRRDWERSMLPGLGEVQSA